jgi:acyl carrier protein
MTSLRQRMAGLIEVATDGDVPAADALGGASLTALGLGSLGLLRLLDAVEAEFGVTLDPHLDASTLDTVDGLATQVAAAVRR